MTTTRIADDFDAIRQGLAEIEAEKQATRNRPAPDDNAQTHPNAARIYAANDCLGCSGRGWQILHPYGFVICTDCGNPLKKKHPTTL